MIKPNLLSLSIKQDKFVVYSNLLIFISIYVNN